jgi:hypothetical protein
MAFATRPRAPAFAACAAALMCLALSACGAGDGEGNVHSRRANLERYVAQVEPIRLAVNRLLEGADPILDAFRQRRIGARLAARRMSGLEARFAEYTVEIASVKAPVSVRPLQAEYAHTYVLEDAYLSALVSSLANGGAGQLPQTQAEQRAAIIAWRTGLTVAAQPLGVALPGDLQQAGRGEIAPALRGAS